MRVLIAALIVGASSLAGCAGSATADGDRVAIVVSTVGRPVPAGFEPAYIIEIDGVRVSFSQRGHRLAPGLHIVRVAPHVQGPTHQVTSTEALALHIDNAPVEIEVDAGRIYEIGMRVLEPINVTRREGRWEAAVVRVRGTAQEPG